ncbi:hypothetical protein [Streptomyces sp. BPTC-684]|uniref:hypothetical protein n=1 Tax=Streptomyces sp. BPTC-684 TaxID=3043734 RepID=UPI0024B0D99A|nr:hypothetical protein [Streptomyces sp. BPTC-684]WHM37669.1 hypothetical protein QIY60_12690 [Streptomyces sp. BPTC-684]
MNLRMIGIGAVVVFTVLLPLAASAGPAEEPEPTGAESAGGDPARTDPTRAEAADSVGADSVRPDSDGPDSVRSGGSGYVTDDSVPDDAKRVPHARVGDASPEPAAHCGPELVSPDGVEAQTCVLTEGHDAWARTYYRNATGGRLRSVLTLMGPGGHTVQTNCAVGAGDQPGVCETPRGPVRGKPGAYSAVAEFAGTGDDAPLLLRSGSNAADGAALNSAAGAAR